jgi:hypothetical protein
LVYFAEMMSRIATVKRWTWNIFCAVSMLIFAGSATIWLTDRFGDGFVSEQVRIGRYAFWINGGLCVDSHTMPKPDIESVRSIAYVPASRFFVFVVPPVLWWWRRRKHRGGRGFAVREAA